MRVPQGGRTGRQQVSGTYSIPAPTLGWNARDPIAVMSRGDAGVLKNWFPTSSDILLRKGSLDYTTGIVDEVETLACYIPPTGSQSLWGFAGTNLYNVSSSGAVGAAVVSGLTHARWQTTRMTTPGGNFLLAVNGADESYIYDGTSWAHTAITGVTESTLINVTTHKERLWFVQKATLDAWYLATQSIAGAATKFPLGSVFKKGGELIAIGTWTIDGGTGPDDLIVFITSQGEVAVYQGTDPASSQTWGLVGVFNIGRPLGYRCMLKFGGDLLILTTDGVMPASRLKDATNKSAFYSDMISGQMATAANLYFTSTGWQLLQYPEANMILLNVPVGVGSQEQYVMNSTTKAWAQFQGWPASCLETLNGELYMGTTGKTVKLWTGTSDNGSNIVAEYVGAFDPFRSAGNKQVHMIRPVIGWDSNPAEFLIGVDTDYRVTTPTNSVAFTPGSAGVWDTGLWDSAIWAGDASYNKDWYSASGIGYVLAPHLLVRSSQATVRFAAIDFIYERAGLL